MWHTETRNLVTWRLNNQKQNLQLGHVEWRKGGHLFKVNGNRQCLPQWEKKPPTKPHKITNSWKVWETCRYCRVTQRDYVQSFRVDLIYRTALNHCCRWRCHRSYLKCHSLNKLQQFNACDIEEMTQVWKFSDHSLEKSALWVMLVYQNLPIDQFYLSNLLSCSCFLDL